MRCSPAGAWRSESFQATQVGRRYRGVMNRRGRGVGVKDVARAAGVSVGTVSNVLNRPDLVAEDTRARVHAAIQKLGFVRNEAARHLRSGSSRAVGLVVIDAANPFFTTLARGVEDTVSERADVVLLGNSGGDMARERRYLELFEQQRVRGVLLAPSGEQIPHLDAFDRLGIPVVFLDRHLAHECRSVSVDDVEGGRIAARHLLGLGHRRLWFAGGPVSLQQVRDRLAGFTDVVRAAGGTVEHVETDRLTVAQGRAVGARFTAHLDAPNRPTALFAANDLVAIGVLNDLVSRGVPVPQTLSIVGFDDIDFAATTTVPLTSVHQPAYEMGREGARLLYSLLDDGRDDDCVDTSDEAGHVEGPGAQVRFTPRLVERETTATARSSNP